jgi:hypothetical protein
MSTLLLLTPHRCHTCAASSSFFHQHIVGGVSRKRDARRHSPPHPPHSSRTLPALPSIPKATSPSRRIPLLTVRAHECAYNYARARALTLSHTTARRSSTGSSGLMTLEASPLSFIPTTRTEPGASLYGRFAGLRGRTLRAKEQLATEVYRPRNTSFRGTPPLG